ncbi:roadblock/LC7 domain-containing protein [Actinophytocola xanthii]|uniref:Roadblock/LAMTOR2 domain-containing protein n=1 Tax=Actinophytocola xanthii TaxID=1912961 RepID=A0A1Q8CMJ2_9PSEU|nr:hypothetical protein [Actinophytocola xanthii]OLF15578.1 hypothetical protein BU204_20885 [Actinophytocola xanthii]
MSVRAVHVQLQDPAAVAELLQRMRATVRDIAGAVVASHDGLVVASDIDPVVEVAANETVGRRSRSAPEDTAHKTSAMAAVAAGLGAQFTQAAGSGTMQAVTFEGNRGCTGVFPLTSALLLVLIGAPQVTMGRFVVASKQALAAMLGPQPDTQR